MKAKELRIGNFVWEDYSGEMIVFGIVTGGINPRAELRKNERLPAGSYHIDTLQGIKLTSEWLEKLGFSFSSDLSVHYLNGIEVESFYDEEGSFKEEAYGVELRYVHQLQNLYFALTGKELELKS